MSFKLNNSSVYSFTNNLRRTTDERLELNRALLEIQKIIKLCCDNDIRTVPEYIACVRFWILKTKNEKYSDDIKNFLILTFTNTPKNVINQHYKQFYSTKILETIEKFKKLYFKEIEQCKS